MIINRFIINPIDIINEIAIDQWSLSIKENINVNEAIIRPKLKFLGKIFLKNLDLLLSSNILLETGATHSIKNNI
tara:strand:+ start:98 stop:322 length:225 start_codon:yes stop_codon:yes gene_type:complete